MTTSHVRYRWAGAVAAAVLVLASPAARADEVRTGDEPWYQQSSADARQQARVLFRQAVAEHQQLLYTDARTLYEQALNLWDNPDIRWNLALVLEEQREYLLAHQELASVLRWKAALGDGRLRDVQDRMQGLETFLARVEAHGDEAGAEVELDGRPWFTGAGSRSELVGPGQHYVSARKPGYFPVTVPVVVTMGLRARVSLQMDADRLIETRRWTWWKPWTVVAAGVLVALAGASSEELALKKQRAAQSEVANGCRASMCSPVHTPAIYHQAVSDHHLAIGAFGVGGSVVAIGLVLAWLNQPLPHRSEPRARSAVELTPVLSPTGTGASALIRF